jgi:hypothetical protein
VPVPTTSLNFFFFFSVYLILADDGPRVHPAFNRNEWQKMFLGSKAQPARNADNLTSICEPIDYKMWDARHLTSL